MKPALLPDFLKPQDGSCLSIYLPRLDSTNLGANKAYLEQVKMDINDILRWSSDFGKGYYFSQAIQRISEDAALTKNRKQNTAIFLTEEGMWSLRFSGQCQPFFSLANSFHIKPMLRYFHRNRKFFVLKFETDRASLYVDGPDGLKSLDSILYSDSLKFNLTNFDIAIGRRRSLFKNQFDEFSGWISDWISQDLVNEDAPLIVTGNELLAVPFRKNATYKGTLRNPLDLNYQDNGMLYSQAKRLMRELVNTEEQQTIKAFTKNRLQGKASTKLPEIAKAAVKDNISVLMIARENHVWGELNRLTGDLRVHHEQLTDLDDDLLDDLAEVTLSNKAKVLVLDQRLMPDGKPVAAIFRQKSGELEHHKELQESRTTHYPHVAALVM